MKKGFIISLLLCTVVQSMAFIPLSFSDSTQIAHKRKKTPIHERVIDEAYQQVKKFSQVDTSYVEPQRYNYTFMVQNITNYEFYRISDNTGQHITFAPKPNMKMGPYFGWRWLVLGYTVDLFHMGSSSKKQDFALSLYSNEVGVDLFYRKTGDDFRIRDLQFNNVENYQKLKDVKFDGFKGSVKGFNVYYIFNHRKFSYPAAYSQSTVQRRSAGSLLAGIGVTKHTLAINWDKMDHLVTTHLGIENPSEIVDNSLRFAGIKYTDISFSVGYAYNWVFARNCLFNASLSTALAYKKSTSDVTNNYEWFRGFSMKNFNLDGVGRFAIVYNNSKWYAGTQAIFHSYNYKKTQFQTSNAFGNVSLYVGFNFGHR